MNVIIFVHTCHKYEESRARKIENTWGAKKNVIFITDNPNSSLKNNIYIGKYKYPGPTYHPENVIKMFYLFITKYNHYDWFMIIDDDSYLYIDRLIKYLEFQDKNDCLMIGDYLNWPEYHNFADYSYNFWISGGPGIVFTKKCIQTFLKLINDYNGNYCNHDVWLHLIFLSKGKKLIKRIHCCGFHQNYIYNLCENELKKLSKNLLISIHLNHNLDLLYKFHNLRTSGDPSGDPS